jgi:hypothetical protein
MSIDNEHLGAHQYLIEKRVWVACVGHDQAWQLPCHRLEELIRQAGFD